MSSGYDAKFDGSIFRIDKKLVILSDFHKAILRPVRLAPRVGGGDYSAGEILGVYTSGPNLGLFANYNNSSGVSGMATAVAILLDGQDSQLQSVAASSPAAPAIFGGGVVLKKTALTGYDATAKSNLGCTEFTDATGITQVIF